MYSKSFQEAKYILAEHSTTCPYCAAEAGQQCRTNIGRWRRNPHKERLLLIPDPVQHIWDLCADTAREDGLLNRQETAQLKSLFPFAVKPTA